ncbi:MAG: hypothetical protein PV340_02530 [Wolbachia sp.]|nr:hypothetical protein [Wolbachia sp.]MDD9336590.1 hypothetical protein [Wolbachia sp.]
MKTNQNFKGLDHYKLQQDADGNIVLNDYDDIFNVRRARIDILLDNTKPDNDVNFIKLNKALNEKFKGKHELLFNFDKEDKEIAQEENKISSILDNLDDLLSIESEDLLEVSLLLSDLSFIERNIVLNVDQNSDLAVFKELFIEKKASGEEYTNEEYKNFIDDIDKINTIIKLELESRIDGIQCDETEGHDDLHDEIGKAMDTINKPKKD